MTRTRTDTEILNWLIAEGYIVELRCYMDGSWGLETDDGEHIGATARKAIERAMEEEG